MKLKNTFSSDTSSHKFLPLRITHPHSSKVHNSPFFIFFLQNGKTFLFTLSLNNLIMTIFLNVKDLLSVDTEGIYLVMSSLLLYQWLFCWWVLFSLTLLSRQSKASSLLSMLWLECVGSCHQCKCWRVVRPWRGVWIMGVSVLTTGLMPFSQGQVLRALSTCGCR